MSTKPFYEASKGAGRFLGEFAATPYLIWAAVWFYDYHFYSSEIEFSIRDLLTVAKLA